MMRRNGLEKILKRLDTPAKILLVISLFAFIFVSAHAAIHDLDIWLHLKAGEVILQSKYVPSHDIFSFTMQGKSWVDHEWLFQLVSYLVYSRWQADGLIFLQSIVIVLAFFVLFLIGYKSIGSYLEPAILTALVAYASMSRFNIRPDIFSLLFFALYLYILKFHDQTEGVWLLVPLQILWVNIHGYFFLGPLLVLLHIFSSANLKRLRLVFLFVGLACLLNPNGLKGALYPFYIMKDLMSGANSVFFKYIQELKPTFQSLKQIKSLFYLYLTAGLCLAILVLNFKRLKTIDAILAAFFFLFSLTLRNVAFFSFVCFIVIISYVAKTIGQVSTNIRIEVPGRQVFYYLLKYALVFIFILWATQRVNAVLGQGYYDFESYTLKSSLSGINQSRYPKAAVDFVLDNKIAPNMLNDFNSGAYLIGRAYPQRKVFIDGRTELYGQAFFERYLKALDGGDSGVFEEMVSKFNIGAALLNMTSTPMPNIAVYMYKDPRWKLVFLDHAAAIFLKDEPPNQALIKKYKIDLSKYLAPPADLNALGLKQIYPTPYLKRAHFFELLEEPAAAISEAKEALRIMPNCAEAYHILGGIYLRKGSYKEAFENLRSAAMLLPGNTDILLDLGKCLRQLNENKGAIHALKGVIEADNSNAAAYYELGLVYLADNDEAKAIESLNKAVKLNIKNPRYHFGLAGAFYKQAEKSQDKSFFIRAKIELNIAHSLANSDKPLTQEIEKKLKEVEGKI
jgi:Tfp pilus assembly protein PilF